MGNEKKRIIDSLIFPTIFVFIIWFVKIFEIIFNLKLAKYGIYPMRIESLHGILFSPLIHADFSHLYANSFSFLILCIVLFYVYREVAYKVFFMIYFLSGFLLWLSGREAYHIGASGIIYGLASFIFFSGLIRKNNRLMALSLLVSFMYGGMIWGVLPIEEKTSWEAHLMGMVTGLLLAVIYRHYGPQKIKYDWEDDEDAENEENNDNKNSDNTTNNKYDFTDITNKQSEIESTATQTYTFVYRYIEKNKE